jgi:uncharacterized membrane protein
MSIAGGAGLIGYGLARRDKAGAVMAALGGLLMHRGTTGHCNMYQTLGVNTARTQPGGVPYELGMRVDQEIRINRPTAELYRFWRDLENLPRFMHHLHSVREIDERTSHWVARAPAGFSVEWDAEIVNEIENQLIGWRSLPGSQVDNGGAVRFEDTGDGWTTVRVSLQYNPPAGTIGAKIAKAFGEDPAKTIRADLQRFKELMETGVLSSGPSQGLSDRWKGNRRWNRDNVQNASEESFPASDAPSWTPEVV